MHQRCNYLLLKAFLLISLQKILNDYRDSDLDLDWDLQSDSDLDSIRNSCDVFVSVL